jgi:hypothetical protein
LSRGPKAQWRIQSNNTALDVFANVIARVAAVRF